MDSSFQPSLYELMDAPQILLFIFVVISTPEHSEAAEPTCKNYDRELINLLEGEAFYFVPYIFESRELPNETFTWYKNVAWKISPDENDRIHHHGAELFFLNLTTQDSGNYTARHIDQSGNCNIYHLKIEVFNTSEKYKNKLLFPTIENSDVNKLIPCPQYIIKTCDAFEGSFTWYMNSSVLQGESQDSLWVMKATKNDEGIYTCVCTWAYNNKVYNSSSSRRLVLMEAAEPTCKNYDRESFNLLEGEAFYFVPYIFESRKLPNETFTWYKNVAWKISPDENDRIHHHGAELFFLNLTTQDSGNYTARHIDQSGKCNIYHLKIEVFNTSEKYKKKLLFPTIENSDVNKLIPCPQYIIKTCDAFEGSFTWYMNSSLRQSESQDSLWVMKATKNVEGIYTCVCTWAYNNKVYNSSASRRLVLMDASNNQEVQILSPAKSEEFADEGYSIKLNCTVFCGVNVKNHCKAQWDFGKMDGISESTTIVTHETTRTTTATQTLTIHKVSATHFETEFKCSGFGLYTMKSVTLRLTRRESLIPLASGMLCVLFLSVSIVVLVKSFTIELVLFFRPCFPVGSHKNNGRLYDAYVIYQMQVKDKATEYTLFQFVANTLPSVLEEKCGYRLFIHGRDDIPGEDCMELVEDRIKQSKRLLVILTLDSGSQYETADECPASPTNSVIGGFDWQVGLHHVLMQGEMKVILVQLGDTGPQGYTHFPPGLQHLIRRCAPIKFPKGSRGATAWNSRFWKRVRYLMPAIPVRKCPQSAIV